METANATRGSLTTRQKIQNSGVLNKKRAIGNDTDIIYLMHHIAYYENLGHRFSADPYISCDEVEKAIESDNFVQEKLMSGYDYCSTLFFYEGLAPENNKVFGFFDLYMFAGHNMKEFCYIVQELHKKGIGLLTHALYSNNFEECIDEYLSEYEGDVEMTNRIIENKYIKFRLKQEENEQYIASRFNTGFKRPKKFSSPIVKQIVEIIDRLTDLEEFCMPGDYFESGQLDLMDYYKMGLFTETPNGSARVLYGGYESDNTAFAIYATATCHNYEKEEDFDEFYTIVDGTMPNQIEHQKARAKEFMSNYEKLCQILT